MASGILPIGEILSSIGNLFNPVRDIIDDVTTSREERLQIELRMMERQADLTERVLAHQEKVVEHQSANIQTEARGESWLQRNWRPIVMLTLTILVVLDSLGFTAFRLADQAWTLIQIGLGGYVVGRSAEKIAPHVQRIVKRDKVSQ